MLLNIYNNTEFKVAKKSRNWLRVLLLLLLNERPQSKCQIVRIAIAEWIFMRNNNNAVLLLLGWAGLDSNAKIL